MHVVKSDLIVVVDRQRQTIAPKDLLELKRSILEKGLLHAPVLSTAEGGHRLIAGERRFRAMCELHEEGHTFYYDGKPIEDGYIPFVTIGELSEVDLWEAELEENILRAPLHWLEEAQAKAKIHRARQKINPGQSMSQTAVELASRSGQAVRTERAELAAAILIEKHKSDPRVLAAKSARDAYKAILDKTEASFKAELARRTRISQSAHKLILGDCREVLPTFPEREFDCIISDPPYGIEADRAKLQSKHFYDDSKDYALELNKFILSHGFKITKNKAVIFLFCDIEHFLVLRDFAAQHAWVPWRTPIIWSKVEGPPGHAPWGKAGFIRSYESILFAVKGQRELYRPGGHDVISNVQRVSRATRVHGAEKPVELYERLLTIACLQGDKILDPCCGSGPIFAAAEKLKLNATGIELDENYHNLATIRIGELYETKTPEREEGEDFDEVEVEDEVEDLNPVEG